MPEIVSKSWGNNLIRLTYSVSQPYEILPQSQQNGYQPLKKRLVRLQDCHRNYQDCSHLQKGRNPAVAALTKVFTLETVHDVINVQRGGQFGESKSTAARYRRWIKWHLPPKKILTPLILDF